jgi:SprB repeat
MKSKPLYSLFLLCSLIAQKNVTAHTLTSRNVFSSVSIDTCLVDSSQANFQAGVLNNVELTSSPGDVKIAGRSEGIDQASNPVALSTTNNLSATTWTGQTFRAGVTGNLTKITMGLGLASGTSGTITVEIRNLNGVNPGTSVLATSTIGPVTNVGTSALYTTTFTTPAAVVSGTSYSIVLRTSVGNTVFGVRGSTAGGSTLANGQVFTTTSSGTTWTPIAADLYFTSYVTPPLTSAASGNLVSGVRDASPAVGFTPVWTTLSWTAAVPTGTAVQLQVAASNNASGPFNFTGPDGTAATFFTTSGAALSQFNGFRYLKYTAFLDAGINATTPVLHDVAACLHYVHLLSATITSSSNVSCNGGSNGSATVSASGGTLGYTYSWSPAGGTAATASGLVAGAYTVTVTDANLFTQTATVTITEPPVLAAAISDSTNVSCNGGSNGSATVSVSGGTAGYTYSWSPSGGTAATASGLAAGTYTVIVTDANTCNTTASVIIKEPARLTASISDSTNISCNGGTNGSATVSVSGGTPGYTYSWSPSGGAAATASGLAAGTYTVTVTDANTCNATAAVIIKEPAILTATVGDSTNVSCNGGSNGSATIIVSGGTGSYNYSWSPSGGTAATASGLTAATYTCSITDSNACLVTKVVTITEPTIITATTSQTNVICNGSSTGSASVIASGGTGGYTYSWSPSGGTGATASDLAAGDYTCNITDANSCSITKDFTITELPAITATTSQTNVTCTGGSTGTATVVASGGTGVKTYSWSPSGGTDATAIDLAAGSYTCTITDENLCSITKTFTITEPTSIPGSNSYLLPTSNQTISDAAGNSNFVNSSCELVSTVLPSGISPVSGTVTSEVWIEATVPTESGSPFVQRHYEITPTTNAADATGTVTLYFTQAEFDNFNAHAGSALNLPADPADNAGKANLRIGKYSGISADGTGLPSSYSGSRIVIDPDDNNIVWNAVSGTWEVTFAVDGFSGFIIQTMPTVLPVKWVSFTLTKKGQSVLLNWSTATELNAKDFIVQYSIDGIKWSNVAVVAAAGNSNNIHYYTYLHNNTQKGYNYYRIMQTDVDGKINYSEIKVIKFAGDYAPFTILGNPIGNGVLQIQVHQAAALSLYEINGKLLWAKQFAAGLHSIDVSRYAKGIYLLQTNGRTQKIFIE